MVLCRRTMRAGLCAGLLLAQSAGAELVESTVQVPVVLAAGQHAVIRQNLTVTVLHESSRGAAPFALIAHGRPASEAERKRMGQVKYPANSVWLVQHGFTVLVPTRIGYGTSGGPDLDYSGACASKKYLQALDAAVAEYRQVLQHMAALAYVDPHRGVVIGESFGGMVALAMADAGAGAVRGAVNFSGGDGGDYSHLEQPCDAPALENSFAGLGAVNRRPVLWLYSENDRFWGERLPRRWFDAFSRAGGRGEFRQLPPDKNNGHFIFNRNVLAWHAELERFLLQLGLPGQEPGAPR